MSGSDLTYLRATVGREASVSCGCVVVECAPRLIDGEGRFVTGRATVVVPCVEEHVVLAREVAAAAGEDADVHEIAAAMEVRL